MNKEITKEQWQAIAEKLAEWCEQMDLYYDYSEHWDKERYVLEAKKIAYQDKFGPLSENPEEDVWPRL